MVPPAPRRSLKPSSRPGTGTVRIIAGRLRGSKLPVADLDGLRPSGDRVRETLFNWLQQSLHGARVLDLFAGSGVLGIECASRGAARVVLVERDARLCDSLRQSIDRLGIGDVVELRGADALAAGSIASGERFDLVFIDPPFAAGLWDAAIARIAPHLSPLAWVYIESAGDVEPAVPTHWQLHREGRTREVRYALYRVEAAP